jgi:L-amino acid N-acyltransferase YncA
MKTLQFNELQESDFPFVEEVYNHYVKHSTSTFHTEPLTINELMDIIYVNHPRYKSYLIKYEGIEAGYCYLSPFKKRPAYDRSAEVTIYLKKEFIHRGIGQNSLGYLESVARKAGFKNLIATVAEDNVASTKLFNKLSYTKCGHIKNAGEKFNTLIDIIFYQKEI